MASSPRLQLGGPLAASPTRRAALGTGVAALAAGSAAAALWLQGTRLAAAADQQYAGYRRGWATEGNTPATERRLARAGELDEQAARYRTLALGGTGVALALAGLTAYLHGRAPAPTPSLTLAFGVESPGWQLVLDGRW